MSPMHHADALNDLAEIISDISERNGFWDVEGLGDKGVLITKLSLIHDEVSEALGVFREPYDDSDVDVITCMTEMQEEDFAEELSDIIIRVLDLAGYYDLDIGESLITKVEKNRERPYRHSKRF